MHVDWLRLKQGHDPQTVPDWGAGWVLALDANGVCEWQTVKALEHVGSYDTRLRIRASAGVVEVDGNPSKWGRLDNVFGLGLDAALALYNGILADLGLPPFSDGERINPTLHRVSGHIEDSCHGRALVTRIDLARTYACGRDLPAVLRALSQQQWHGKPPSGHGPGSLSWGSRRYRRLKAYDKGAEMAKHRTPECSESDAAYLQGLREWVKEQGLMRWEMELGRDGLRQLGMRFLGEMSEQKLEDVMQSVQKKMFPSVGAGGLEDVAEALRANGYGQQVAERAQGIAYQWAAEVDVFSQMRRPTAYRYRAILAEVGIDIRQPLQDVTALRVQPRVVELAEPAIPSWYRAAA